jgi:hypothetical protein
MVSMRLLLCDATFVTFCVVISKHALKNQPNIIVFHTSGSQIRQEEDGELSHGDLIPFRVSITKK